MFNCSRHLTSIALLLLAFPGSSHASCSGSFSLGASGGVSDWVICSAGSPIQAVNRDHSRFDILLSGEGLAQADFTQWQRIQTSDDKTNSFQFIDPTQTVEISRTYQVQSNDNVTLSISIKNLSERPLRAVRLALQLGDRNSENGRRARSLADYVYRFERVEAISGTGEWQFPSGDLPVTMVAITSRHASILIESNDLIGLESVLEPEQEEPSPFDAGDWYISLVNGGLGPGEERSTSFRLTALPTRSEVMEQSGVPDLVYADVWGALGTLCRWIESALQVLSRLVGNLGIALILLAVMIRLVTLPASTWASRQQELYRARFGQAKPKIELARKELKGAEQSERILEIYKEHRITPFSGLKGSLGLLIQIPFLLAVFNVTTRSSIFANEQFMWIGDLANPDAIMSLPFMLPVLGGNLNVLPLLLGAFNIWSAIRDRNVDQSSIVVPVLISLLIVTAFYSFSSALVLYWLSVNVIHAGEKVLIARARAKK